MTWPDVIETLRDAGLEDWRIARGIAVIRMGGRARDAEDAVLATIPVRAASFGAERGVSEATRAAETVRVER